MVMEARHAKHLQAGGPGKLGHTSVCTRRPQTYTVRVGIPVWASFTEHNQGTSDARVHLMPGFC